jgi:hypothetical protein
MDPVDDDGVVPRFPSRAAMAFFDRDRWQRLHPLLDRALDLPDGERASWLDELRVTSPDVADDLIALLSAEAEADYSGFLLGGPAHLKQRPDSLRP